MCIREFLFLGFGNRSKNKKQFFVQRFVRLIIFHSRIFCSDIDCRDSLFVRASIRRIHLLMVFSLQGTSRLVSTDSEGLNNSQSPLHQAQPPCVNYSQSAAAAALVAVLSDDLPVPDPVPPPVEAEPIAKARKPRSKPIKLKLKTSAKEKSEIVEPVAPTRARKRQKEAATAEKSQLSEENQSVAQRVAPEAPVSDIVSPPIVEGQPPAVEPPKPKRRTAAAKKLYKDPEEVVVPPSEPVPAPVASAAEESDAPPVTKKGRKGKKAATVPEERVEEREEPPPATTTRSGRATRNKPNGTMMVRRLSNGRRAASLTN